MTQAEEVSMFFKNQGLLVESYIVDIRCGLIKIAVSAPFVRPTDVANTITKIIGYFSEKVKPENRQKYLQNFAAKLSNMDALLLSTKKSNPGAGIGATLGLIKNLLGSHSSAEVSQILAMVVGSIGA